MDQENSNNSEQNDNSINQQPTDQVTSEYQTDKDQQYGNQAIVPVSPDLDIDRSTKPHSNKKLYIIIAIVFVVLVVVSAYFFLKKDDKTNTKTNSASSQNTQQSVQNSTKSTDVEAKSLLAENVVYSFRDADTKPYSLFWRSASGGERTLSQTLATKMSVGFSDVKGSVIGYVSAPNYGATDKESLWVSTDYGKTYKKLYTPVITNQLDSYSITSLKISEDLTKIAIGQVRGTGSEAIEIDIATGATKQLFTSTQRGTFINAYDSKNQKVIYSEGCFQCDGNIGRTIYLKDLAKNTNKELIKSSEILVKNFVSVNKDFSEVLVMGMTKDAKANIQNSIDGSYLGAPYSVITINLTDMSEKTLASYGSKPTNLDAPALYNSIGYMNDQKTPYYALDKQIFSLSGSKPSLLFESTKSIYDVYFVSNESVIYGAGDYKNFTLNNFSIKDKKDTLILNGDSNTSIIGLTTK